MIRYGATAALRDLGKALGLTEDLIRTLSSRIRGGSEEGPETGQVEDLKLDPRDRRLRGRQADHALDLIRATR